MFGRKILFLAAWYVAGNVVSSLYTSKKGKDLQAEMKRARKKWTESEVFISNIIETQKNLFGDVAKYIPKEHQKIFYWKKKEFLWVLNSLQKYWDRFLQNLQEQWSDSVTSAAKKVWWVAQKVAKKAEELEKNTKK